VKRRSLLCRFALKKEEREMGYSTPKTPFDLTEFLGQKATSKSYRRPVWGRKPAIKPKVENDAGAADGTGEDAEAQSDK